MVILEPENHTPLSKTKITVTKTSTSFYSRFYFNRSQTSPFYFLLRSSFTHSCKKTLPWSHSRDLARMSRISFLICAKICIFCCTVLSRPPQSSLALLFTRRILRKYTFILISINWIASWNFRRVLPMKIISRLLKSCFIFSQFR